MKASSLPFYNVTKVCYGYFKSLITVLELEEAVYLEDSALEMDASAG